MTEADQGAEHLVAERLLAARPGHGLFGEEHGVQGDTTSPWRWVVDPIDGTSGFVRGIPVWATLIALTHVDLGPVVGVVSAPALGRRWWARARPRVARRRSPAAGCRTSRELADAQVCITFSPGWDDARPVARADRTRRRAARRARGFGDFWQHCLVAEGSVDLAVDAVGVMPYDLAAVKVIVEEAGGRFTDRHGNATHEHDSAISSNGLLHDLAVARLG